MKRKLVATANAPAAIGPYSQAVSGDGLLCISGQLPIDPENGGMPDTIGAQTEQAMKNVLAILRAAGGHEENILRCGLFVRNMGDFGTINEVYARFFQGEPPARFVIEVAALPKGALVEIEAIAVL